MSSKAKEIIRAQQKKTAQIMDYGEQHIKDVFEKMRQMIDLLNKRQKKILATAYSGSLSHDVIKEMGEITIDFNIEKEFEDIKGSLGKPDSKTVELYLEKFESISNKITAGNDIMEKISEGLIQRIYEQDNSTQEIKSQILNLQNSIDQNKDLIDRDRKKDSDEIKKFVDEKSKSFSSELSAKNSEIYKTIEERDKKLVSDFKAIDDETRRRIQENTDGIQKQLKFNYDASSRNCEEKYKDLEFKMQKIQKQIKEIITTTDDIAQRYEKEKAAEQEMIEKERRDQIERERIAREQIEKEEQEKREIEEKIKRDEAEEQKNRRDKKIWKDFNNKLQNKVENYLIPPKSLKEILRQWDLN